jgi:hypothetical protein
MVLVFRRSHHRGNGFSSKGHLAHMVANWVAQAQSGLGILWAVFGTSVAQQSTTLLLLGVLGLHSQQLSAACGT